MERWWKAAWSGQSTFLLHHVDSWVHVHLLPGKEMAPASTMGRRQARGGSVKLWAMFFWKIFHVDTLTRATYLNPALAL